MSRPVTWMLGVALVLLGFVLPVTAADPPAAAKPIDVVICLDTSNSMDGLIASAKAKLWDIVNELARAKPTPDLRVALYSYGNDGYDSKNGWVRKDVDLTNDLDLLYQKLNALTTRGGTEYATRVSRDALQQQPWSTNKDALRLIFVCGNEPAAQDPVVKIKDAAELAAGKGVIINTIYCGNPNDNVSHDWKEFAQAAGGRFTSINQERGAVVIATPHDKELAELSGKLNTTYVWYGTLGKEKGLNQAAQDANAARAGAGVAAARADAKSGALYRNEDADLVDKMKKDPKFDVKKVPEAELSEELKKMTPEKREAHVKEMAAKRDEIQKKINELSTKRQAYINEELKKNPNPADKAFDEAVKATLRDQAAAKGFKVSDK